MAEKLKRTPLFAEHEKLGAKLIPFAGFEMPVQYPEGVVNEHRAVRRSAGLFDVSHMGEFLVTGDDAEGFVNYLVANDVSRLDVGQAQYTVMCQEDGGIIDDLLVYRFAERIRIVVNAANIEKDFDWVRRCQASYQAGNLEVRDESEKIALLALQGPESESILGPLADADVSKIGYYRFVETRVVDEPSLVSRTVYTGEDGFEIYCDAEVAAKIWRAVMEGGGAGIKPAGLGARDTLRLEMGYALYGNDIDEGTSPLEANLGWTVKLEKGEFVGRSALLAQKEQGVHRRLSGFVLEGRGFPRPGYEIRCAGASVSEVRSGTVGPTVDQGIGTGYLPTELAKPGTEIEIVVRGRPMPAQVVRMPFYKGGSIKR